MQRFAKLFAELNASASSRRQLDALAGYWREAPTAHAAWAVQLLAGQGVRRAISAPAMKAWAMTSLGLSPWLFEASCQATGDTAEAMALVWPQAEQAHPIEPACSLDQWMSDRLTHLRQWPQEQQLDAMRQWLAPLSACERLVLIKLITGTWRTPIKQGVLVQSLAEHSSLPMTVIALRLNQNLTALSTVDVVALLAPLSQETRMRPGSLPYPFFDRPTNPLEAGDFPFAPTPLGQSQWQLEWRFDGLRVQVVRRGGETAIWSRDATLLTERFPEITKQAARWPDGTVVEGLLVATRPTPHPFLALPFSLAPLAELQQRRARNKLSPATLRAVPCALLAFDLLEWQGRDLRNEPAPVRRICLEQNAVPMCDLLVTPTIHRGPTPPEWPEMASKLSQCSDNGTTGLILKQDQAAGTAQTVTWWTFRPPSKTIKAVLVYAQPSAEVGQTDYTFALWNKPPTERSEIQAVLEDIKLKRPPVEDCLQLVTIAKTSGGLSMTETTQLAKLIRETTVGKFGPVRSLLPSHIFEIEFDGVVSSKRHKSGLLVRPPRIRAWRADLTLQDADTLANLGHWVSS
jgi:DNA ligase-1